MNRSIFKQKTVTLQQLRKKLTKEERKFVDAEKQYYHVVVALKNKRKELGLTQTQLARLSSIPRTTITKVESGSRNTTLQTLMAMAQAMGKSVELRLF